MTVGDRVFERLRTIGMTQKEFSERTGIAQSTISDWKKKKNNPTAEKIMIICEVLDVTPSWLLSGAIVMGKRSNVSDYYVVDKKTELGVLVERASNLDSMSLERALGYLEALQGLKKGRKLRGQNYEE